MLCYSYGSVSDHFGPSAFNKFGFGFSINYKNTHKSRLECDIKHDLYKIAQKLKTPKTYNLDLWVFLKIQTLGFRGTFEASVRPWIN